MENSLRNQYAQIPERISGSLTLRITSGGAEPGGPDALQTGESTGVEGEVHNPVRMLREIPVEFLKRAAENPAYLRRYDIAMRRFRSLPECHRNLVL